MAKPGKGSVEQSSMEWLAEVWPSRTENPRWRSPRLSAALQSRAAAGRNTVGAGRRADRQHAHRDHRGSRSDIRQPMRRPRRAARANPETNRFPLVAKADRPELITRKSYHLRHGSRRHAAHAAQSV